MTRASAALAQLAEDYYDIRSDLSPLIGLFMGVSDAPTVALPDVSVAGEARFREQLQALLDRAEAISDDTLSDTEKTTRLILTMIVTQHLKTMDLRTVEMTLDGFMGGPQAILLMALPRTVVSTRKDAVDLLARLQRIPVLLSDTIDRLRAGVHSNRTVTRIGAEGAARQSRALIAHTGNHPFLTPFTSAIDAGIDVGDALAQARQLIGDELNPALSAYATAIENELLPTARDDDHVGLCHLADGMAVYATALAEHTTTDLTPPEIHTIGLDVIAQLADEYTEIGERLFGTGDLTEIFARLRDDPTLRYDTGEEAVTHAQTCVDRAAAVADGWFGRLPARPCVVTPMPEATAKGMTVAYYSPPQGTEGAHGTYWINTHGPVITRYEAESVAFHEAVPGHHLQLALQAELDLPRFRQTGLLVTAYAEGWGLYTERLADEMGLHSGDLARLGMLAMDSARGCRLVIDTGLHHFGWSRQQALDYMLANAPISEALANAEVDRYCLWPGQACSYMIGRHEIVRLRAHAEETLGEAFMLSDFHDVVLGEGQVPLAVLAANVNRWINDVQQRSHV